MLENCKDVLSVNELYNILPVGKSAIYKLLNSGKIKNLRIGNKIIIPKENVIEFLKSA